jgi:uncharacterized membrane protein
VKTICLIFLSFFMTSCSAIYPMMGIKGTDTPPGNQEKPSPEMLSKISFSDVMTEVFQPKCITCHGSSGGVSLVDFQSARQFLKEIEQAALIENRMPKSPVSPLTDRERLILRAWIDAGAPERPAVGEPKPLPPEPVLEATFDSIRSQILEKKCVLCHKAGGKAERIPLSTREDLLNSPLEIVIPGNPEESMLMIVTQAGARKPMPPKSSGITPLTAEQIDIVGRWILNGAKD